MRYRKLTAAGDYTFGNGQKDFYRDVPEAVGQAVETRFRLWLGEWFLNVEDGMPWMEGVLGKHSQPVADITVQDRILTTADSDGNLLVTGIPKFESALNPDTRAYSAEPTIDTIYGPTIVDISNYQNF